MKISRLAYAVVLAGLLAGCGLAPVERGQHVTLGPNEGIAAVVMDTLDPLNQIQLWSPTNDGKGMTIPSAPVGVSMYLFVVPAGNYCVASFWFGQRELYLKDRKQGVCFQVVAGKIAYSGNLAPRAYGPDDLRTDQNFEWGAFETKLKAEYPEVAAQYPIAR